jgi:hypothetical protein
MKIELKINGQTFKKTIMFNNLYTLLYVVFMLTSVILEVCGMAYLINVLCVSKLILVYSIFIVYKNFFIYMRLTKDS